MLVEHFDIDVLVDWHSVFGIGNKQADGSPNRKSWPTDIRVVNGVLPSVSGVEYHMHKITGSYPLNRNKTATSNVVIAAGGGTKTIPNT